MLNFPNSLLRLITKITGSHPQIDCITSHFHLEIRFYFPHKSPPKSGLAQTLPLSIPSGDSTQFSEYTPISRFYPPVHKALPGQTDTSKTPLAFPNFDFSITLDTSQHRGKQSIISLYNIWPLPYHFLSLNASLDTKLGDRLLPITP